MYLCLVEWAKKKVLKIEKFIIKFNLFFVISDAILIVTKEKKIFLLYFFLLIFIFA